MPSHARQPRFARFRMTEIELKFQVPADARAAVRRAVATPTAETVRLHARYFDTADRRLASAGVALRLRQEGTAWVQTLKTRGDGVMERGEHEVALPRSRGIPAIDPSRHAGTPAGAGLRQALGADADGLREIFATDIRRTRRRARTAGLLVEVALDEGEIRAGGQRVPVCEVEFELLRGAPGALPGFASKWVERHGIWLDPRSKAEIGDRLARHAAAVPVKAQVPRLHGAMSGDDAYRALLASALDQVLRNACELADGSRDAEHLHQCRVGMRRLRCALRDFAALASTPPDAAALRRRIGTVFQRLGGARDRDALREGLLPHLVAAGAPIADLPPAVDEGEDAGAVLRDRAANRLWLDLLAAIHSAAAVSTGLDTPPLKERLGAILRRLHRQIADDAPLYSALDEAARHRTRKRLKRLRYGAEFCASLYPPKAVARFLDLLRPGQDALGEANDLVVARAMFEAQVAADPRAWFVLGWLAARGPVVTARCAEALARIAGARGFWSHRR